MRADGTYMGFVGVTTTSSSIMKIFPEWARALNLPTDVLLGQDIALGAPPSTYREAVGAIREDPHHRGALVTTHKMSVFESARDLFDAVDPLAETFGEVSSIAKRGDRLIGSAKDPITVRVALEEFLPQDHFAATGASALILGSGGAGSALSHALGTRTDAPAEIICTALSQGRLDHLRDLHERARIPAGRMRYVLISGSDADDILTSMPANSLVVNATGMGKDRPGSPLGDDARFPRGSVVWEFNYRGSLEFLHQAKSRTATDGVTVHDGWRYFIHGWTQVIADVFDIPMPTTLVDELAKIAEPYRA